jgi:small subunit ribosomal protein S15
MALTTRKKQNIIKEHQIHEADTGSAEIQVGLITKRITELTDHLKKHTKDNHSRRGLLMMVGKRKRLLNYLSKNRPESYATLIRKLGLKR